ncbi:PAS domain-containing protein, partial [Marinobacter sp.]|nr:PAS domain-containing sensor histidine kinase [Marinobacter sp.]
MSRERKQRMPFHPVTISGSSYKSILDSLTTAVLVLGDDLAIRYLNPAAESLFETSMTRSHGLPLQEVLVDS